MQLKAVQYLDQVYMARLTFTLSPLNGTLTFNLAGYGMIHRPIDFQTVVRGDQDTYHSLKNYFEVTVYKNMM
jgi:hypothetical protein